MLAMELLWQMLGQMGTLLYTPVFWLAVGLVYLQTRRWAHMRQALFQLRRETIAGRVAATVAIGMVGGLVASVLLFLLGVSVDQIGLFYVWAVALLLMLFRQRLFCLCWRDIGTLQCTMGLASATKPSAFAVGSNITLHRSLFGALQRPPTGCTYLFM